MLGSGMGDVGSHDHNGPLQEGGSTVAAQDVVCASKLGVHLETQVRHDLDMMDEG